jgi:hypothetical protein
MMVIKIKHQRIERNWLNPNDIKDPKTLVLGSFNPFESESNSVDFYYGRHSNYFWRTIAIIIGRNEDYFFDIKDGLKRKKEIMDNKFCFYDVIDSIDFCSESEENLKHYLKKEIFNNFSDQKIWTSKTNYKKENLIMIKRSYNDSILQFLENSDTIKKVIHTMGTNRIMRTKAFPVEKTLKKAGFDVFIKNIKSICNRKNIEFILNSFSPSGYAVKARKTNSDDLKNWLNTNLWLND